MEITGVLEQKLAVVTGTGKNGEWKKQEFILKTQGEYPKDVCLQAWGKTIDFLDKANTGDAISVQFDLESRENNGNWFSNIKAFRIEVTGKGIQPQEDLPEFLR